MSRTVSRVGSALAGFALTVTLLAAGTEVAGAAEPATPLGVAGSGRVLRAGAGAVDLVLHGVSSTGGLASVSAGKGAPTFVKLDCVRINGSARKGTLYASGRNLETVADADYRFTLVQNFFVKLAWEQGKAYRGGIADQRSGKRATCGAGNLAARPMTAARFVTAAADAASAVAAACPNASREPVYVGPYGQLSGSIPEAARYALDHFWAGHGGIDDVALDAWAVCAGR